jgi:hypothetical protein
MDRKNQGENKKPSLIRQAVKSLGGMIRSRNRTAIRKPDTTKLTDRFNN